jgi:hypothetical protein
VFDPYRLTWWQVYSLVKFVGEHLLLRNRRKNKKIRNILFLKKSQYSISQPNTRGWARCLIGLVFEIARPVTTEHQVSRSRPRESGTLKYQTYLLCPFSWWWSAAAAGGGGGGGVFSLP